MVFEADAQMCVFGVLWLSCASPAALGKLGCKKGWPKSDWPKSVWPKSAMTVIFRFQFLGFWFQVIKFLPCFSVGVFEFLMFAFLFFSVADVLPVFFSSLGRQHVLYGRVACCLLFGRRYFPVRTCCVDDVI